MVERCVNVRALGDAQREELILKHIPLLKHLVGRVAVDLPSSVDRDDLYGFGMLGLIGAADTWDQDRGLKFSTFAYARIRGAMLDELRKLDFLPRGRRDKVRNVERAVSQLEQENGVPPAPEELAAHLEEGDVPLERALEVYESAVHLFAFCRQRLDGMEQRIEQLSETLDGTLTVESVSPTVDDENG